MMKSITILIIFSIQLYCQVSLDSAYKANSFVLLNDIFSEWVDYSKPRNEDRLKNTYDFEKYAYEIFEDFYTPLNLPRIGKSEWGDSLYYHIKYALIQNEIEIAIYDTLANSRSLIVSLSGESILNIKILDFRPCVKIDGVRNIYLSYWNERRIKDFLENTYTSIGENNIMQLAHASGETEKRLSFLNNFVKIHYGHWGGYWELETHPKIYIRFNKELTKAAVDFRLVYEGGTAYYERVSNKWEYIRSSTTWIE